MQDTFARARTRPSARATIGYYSAGKRDRGKRHPREEGGEAPRLHRTGGEAPCSMKGRKTRREENVFKGVENLPALLYVIHDCVNFENRVYEKLKLPKGVKT